MRRKASADAMMGSMPWRAEYLSWVEALPEGPDWVALRDRLNRAVAG